MQDWVAVTEFRSNIHFNRNPAHFLYHIFADDARMPRAAAGYDMDSSAVFDFFLCQGNISQINAVFRQTGQYGLFQRFGLLHDFLHHKVIVAAFFGRVNVPGHVENILMYFGAVHAVDMYSVFLQHSNLAFLQQVIFPRVFQQSGDIGRDVVFTIAQPNQERAVLPYGNQSVRVLAAKDSQRVGSADSFQQPACRLEHIAVVIILKQLCYDLRICFRLERVAFFLQKGFQFQIVFNDAVMHNGNFAVLAVMGVAVDMAGNAMRCPTGVPNADMGEFFAFSGNFFFQICQPPFCFDRFNFTVFKNGNSGGVVPAVFQLFQAAHQNGNGLRLSNVSNNSTHCCYLRHFIRPLPFFCRGN